MRLHDPSLVGWNSLKFRLDEWVAETYRWITIAKWYMSVWESVCVCVCVWERERERESVFVCACARAYAFVSVGVVSVSGSIAWMSVAPEQHVKIHATCNQYLHADFGIRFTSNVDNELFYYTWRRNYHVLTNDNRV